MADAALVTNASDREQVKRATRKEKDRATLRKALVASVLESLDGRQFVWEELERHGVFDRLLAPGGELVAVGMFLGTRDAGLSLLQEVMTDHPHAYLLMQQEAVLRRTKAQAENEAAATPRQESN